MIGFLFLVSLFGAVHLQSLQNYSWHGKIATFQQIYSQGCCNDRLECRDINGTATYLGVDTVFRANKAGTQFRFALVFRQLISRLFQFQSDLVPRFQAVGLLTPNRLSSWQGIVAYICPTLSPNEGFVRAAFYYSNELYLVCNETLYNIGDVNSINRTRVKKKWDRRSTECEKLPHPALCIEGEEDDKLIDLIALPRPNDEDPLVLAFYGTSQLRDVHSYRRQYQIVGYKGSEKFKTTKVSGWLSAVDWYETRGGKINGFYFTNDGNACPFSRSMDSDDIEIEDIKLPRQPCQAFTTFMSCPQPWCFDNRFDSSFTILEKGKYMIYFLRGIFYWRIFQRPLPMNVPRSEDAIFTGTDATKTCEEYRNNAGLKEVLPCVMMQTDMSFAHYYKGTEYVYMLKPIHGWYRVVNKTDNKNQNYKSAAFPNHADSAWFNNAEDAVYLFTGTKYASFKFDGNDWKADKNGALSEFGITEPIDAVVNIDNKGYMFTSKSWFYEVPEKDWKKSSRNKELSFIKFFSVHSDCYYNDEAYYQDLVERYGIPRQQQPPQGQFIVGYVTDSPIESTIAYILLIIFVGVCILAVGCVAMYVKGKPTEDSDDEAPSDGGGGEAIVESKQRRKKRLAMERKRKEKLKEKKALKKLSEKSGLGKTPSESSTGSTSETGSKVDSKVASKTEPKI